eukprot:Phypoly_transcript_21804.p1 GENE.Phypoly_transcript_21804~~Phypoly_transcript_21804.p1  ORF type:complete len:101 (+),score=12.05 Phypoly_transcript_21804:153-455(+)
MTSTVEHVVFFKIKESSLGLMKTFHEDFENLRKIPGLLELSFGPTITTAHTAGYNYGLRAKFVDEASMTAYLPHPLHMTAVSKLQDHLAGPVAVLDWFIN